MINKLRNFNVFRPGLPFEIVNLSTLTIGITKLVALVMNASSASRRDLIDILIKLDISIILVTHDLPMALEICERSLVLNEGIIKEDSFTKDILQNKQLMKENRLELPYGFALHHLGEE